MSTVRRQRKINKAVLRTKKISYHTHFRKVKLYKTLYEKLRSNNKSLAKALSEEKVESQYLLSQNIALLEKVQDLGIGLNERDKVINQALNNAKEMITMVVSMTQNLTNTISICQQFISTSTTNTSCQRIENRESCSRLSIKPPTKGVVKPMVSGLTITKPTISLSRINVKHPNKITLDTIMESSPPQNRNQDSVATLLPPLNTSNNQARLGNRRRLPERMTAVSPKSDEEESRSRQRKNRCSKRQSNTRLSKTNEKSMHEEPIGSPQVKLNDVSKFLRNSQSINIQLLNSNELNNSESNNISTNVTLKEENINKRNSKNEKISTNESIKINSSFNNSNNGSINSADEDPLEGPSWLLDDSQISRNTSPLNTNNVSDDDSEIVSFPDKTIKRRVLNSLENSPNEKNSNISERKRNQQKYSRKSFKNKDNSNLSERENDDFNLTYRLSHEDKQNYIDPDLPIGSFITCRRTTPNIRNDETEDFSLMVSRKPMKNRCDISDLRFNHLPDLDRSSVDHIPGFVPNNIEPEPEITKTVPHINMYSVPSLSTDTTEKLLPDESTLRLIRYSEIDFVHNKYLSKDRTNIAEAKLSEEEMNLQNSMNDLGCSISSSKKTEKKRKRPSKNKDPSTAKVVLQKLNEINVDKKKNSSEADSSFSTNVDHSSDSDGSCKSVTSTRPKRERAPVCLKEPTLRKKLRR